jgi:hypothetical protein
MKKTFQTFALLLLLVAAAQTAHAQTDKEKARSTAQEAIKIMTEENKFYRGQY